MNILSIEKDFLDKSKRFSATAIAVRVSAVSHNKTFRSVMLIIEIDQKQKQTPGYRDSQRKISPRSINKSANNSNISSIINQKVDKTKIKFTLLKQEKVDAEIAIKRQNLEDFFQNTVAVRKITNVIYDCYSNYFIDIKQSINRKNISVSALHTASRRMNYFTRKGIKSGRECQFRNFIVKRSFKNQIQQKQNQQKQLLLQKSRQQKHSKDKVQVQKISSLFKNFYLAATPYIKLKIRRSRRGKFEEHKLKYRDSSLSERKSLVGLASNVHSKSKGRASKPIRTQLEQELDSLINQTRSRFNPSTSKSIAFSSIFTSNIGSLSLREKRDLLHRIANFSRPYRWKKNAVFIK